MKRKEFVKRMVNWSENKEGKILLKFLDKAGK